MTLEEQINDARLTDSAAQIHCFALALKWQNLARTPASAEKLTQRDTLNSCAVELENALHNAATQKTDKAMIESKQRCDHEIGFLEPIGLCAHLSDGSVMLVRESWKEWAEKELKPGREMLSLWEFCPLCGKQINPLPAASAEQYETAERLRKLAHPNKQ